MTKKILLPYLMIFASAFVYSNDIKINKIEPPNWWTGMNLNKVQLMVYGENLNNIDVSFGDSKIIVRKVHRIENPSYAFIDIEIPSDLKAGDYKLILQNPDSRSEVNYSILERERSKEEHSGFNPDDIIYLVMPDRFANGDPSNDIVEGYGSDIDRSKGIARHGGDLQGIINQLDYIKSLGFTALWLNPVIENNAPVSYHGYGATDFYKVDPRLGTKELYKKLVYEAHRRGIKIILDHVANHIHINHLWMKNLPMKDWINGSVEDFHISNHDKVAIFDIHGDKSTLQNSITGWFTDYMPDLNQNNAFLANYIIQNTIWWMEYAGIDAIREDTYPYSDPGFMSVWAKSVLDEYPNTNIVGEVWKGDPVFLAFYQDESILSKTVDSNLPSITDFGLADAIRAYLKGSRNLQHIYETIAMDFVYSDPFNLMTFIDNHDLERAMLVAKDDIDKVKIALHILLTTRGIPQIYYGTEIGIAGGKDDGSKRTDFPGGFPGDTRNAFTEEGRTEIENELFNLIKKLIKIRKENRALSLGKLIHFPPKDGTYIYFRILENERVMIVVNDNEDEKRVDLKTVSHLLENVKGFEDLKTGQMIEFEDSAVTVKAEDAVIYKLISE